MAQSAPNDPIVNAVVGPEASRFVRLILRSALGNLDPDLERGEIADAQALYANVIMNDILNWWNEDLLENGDVAQTVQIAQDNVDSALNYSSKLPSALHARGLIRRQRGQHNDARKDFREAKRRHSSFARAQAQFGNQKSWLNQLDEVQAPLDRAIVLDPDHPAIGYCYWAKGRGYFIEAASASQPDWSDAIKWLQKSVSVLDTVWYNQLYMAAALNATHDTANVNTANIIMNKFVNDPKFGEAVVKRASDVLLVQNPSSPLEKARQNVYSFIQPWVP
ncbi:MAG TPA: hypothetical protein VGM07_15265 [Stellaceae bacterium]|jgi:tetratricopeptide (TPR) repeat protein